MSTTVDFKNLLWNINNECKNYFCIRLDANNLVFDLFLIFDEIFSSLGSNFKMQNSVAANERFRKTLAENDEIIPNFNH